MKKICSLFLVVMLVLLGLGLSTARATFTNTLAVPVTFAVTALIQSPTSGTFGPTNSSGVTIAPYTTITYKLSNQDILKMLQTEFATSFPAGAVLGYSLIGGKFGVYDASGALLLNVASHPSDSSYVFALSNSVAGGSFNPVMAGTDTINYHVLSETKNLTENFADYGIFYADGHGNHFHIIGLVTVKVTSVETVSTSVYKLYNVTIAGQGEGTFFNPLDGNYDWGVFTQATFSLKGVNLHN